MSPTLSSDTSTPALYLSNWTDLVGIWKASKLSQLDSTGMGPRLSELHYLRGSLERRRVNQIVDYTGFFRDESANVSYTNVHNFDADAWFESGAGDAGIMTTTYRTYTGAAQQPRLQVSRSFAGSSEPAVLHREVYVAKSGRAKHHLQRARSSARQ